MKQETERNFRRQGIWCLVLIGLLVWCAAPAVNAQNRKVQFETKSWKQVLKKARKQERLVFLDCYTEWCGFCKALDKYIFTMDTVADFFNERFVNVQMDMEKGIGSELCKQYAVTAFPTLLFIDGKGNLVDSWVGYAAPYELFALGTRAVDPKHSLAALAGRYESGERHPAFLEEYMAALKRSTWGGRCQEIMARDVASLEDVAFYTPEVWSLLKHNTGTAFNLLMNRVVENRELFDCIVGQQEVDSILDKAFMAYTTDVLLQAARHRLNHEEVQDVESFLQTHRLPYAGEYLAILYTAESLDRADYVAVLKNMKEVMKYNFLRLSSLDEYVNTTLRAFASLEDKQIRQEAAGLVKAIPSSFIRFKKKAMYEATYKMLVGTEKEK